MKKNNGFTLIELLAVIVILAIIALISTPIIIGLIDDARREAFKNSAYGIIKSGEFLYSKDLLNGTNEEVTFTYTDGVESSNVPGRQLNYKGTKPQSGTIRVNTKGEVAIAIYDGKYCIEKSYETSEVTLNVKPQEECALIDPIIYYSEIKGVNKPLLTTGMTPVKWNGTDWVNTTEDDEEWYNYTTADKKWANAKTADGSFWVWIPRYAYSIASGYHTNTAGTINIKFLKNKTSEASDGTTVDITPTYSLSSQTNYVKHPSFTFGTDEVLGIWVAKFPASVADTSSACYTVGTINNCDNSILLPKIVPGVKAWVCITDDNAFTVLRNMETNATFGWGTSGNNIDTHMMKNIEWGAAAYLAKSDYGKNTEIVVNTTLPTYTGGGIGNVYATTPTRSTTGNIYGIYDMSGGAWQKVAAYVNNGKSLGTGVFINADAKYKDVYQVAPTDNNTNNYALNSSKFGDAMYEISSITGEAGYSWYGDYSNYPADTLPRIIRSGHGYYMGAAAGIFAFQRTDGGNSCTADSFRPVIMIGEGL